MRLFRYELIWKDGQHEYGMGFANDGRDLSMYLTAGITQHIYRINVIPADDEIVWPELTEAPCHD